MILAAVVGGGLVAHSLNSGNATPSGCGPPAPGWRGRVTGVRILATRPRTEARVIVLVNQFRVARGLRLLVVDERLALAARYHDADMQLRGYFEHERAGESFPQRMARYTPCGRLGETMTFGSAGYATAAGIVSLWRASSGHRAVLLAPWARRVGVGVRGARLFGNLGTVATADFSA